MEVAYPPGLPASANIDNQSSAMAVDDMDIDIDIDLDPTDVNFPIESTSDQPPETHSSFVAPAPINVDDVTPHKLHIRGLDDLTTKDITSYLTENIHGISHTRIEWVNDTSANVVFPTPAAALKALEQITAPQDNTLIANSQLRTATSYTARPAVEFQVRLALTTDQKRPKAYEASKFYLMHPDLDPRERARKERFRDGGSSYRRPRYGHDEQRRRRRNDRDEGFDASMYDDVPSTSVKNNRRSTTRRSLSSMVSANSSDEADDPADRRCRHSRRGGEYFRPRTRNRSASPDMDISNATPDASSRRLRRRTPPPSPKNHGKELFPSKPAPGTALTGGAPQDLFPNKKHAANLKKELFPSKPHQIHHRRSDAVDAADVTADLFANRLAFSHSAAHGAAKTSTSSFGRLNAPSEATLEDQGPARGLNIRGASKQNQGFSIRGVAADGTRVGIVKELFPDKSGSNLGKELFAEKLEGRGGRRNWAADLFI